MTKRTWTLANEMESLEIVGIATIHARTVARQRDKHQSQSPIRITLDTTREVVLVKTTTIRDNADSEA